MNGRFWPPGQPISASSARRHSGNRAPSELERLEREIAATDEEIDNLVYELYGITDEERSIVENAERKTRRPVPGGRFPVLGTNDARLWRGA
jgi:hypothetical protein